MTENSDDAIWRQGRVWMSAVGVVTAIAGWFVYDAMMAPAWMRELSLEMTARATIVSDRSKETAFSTMRGRPEPDSPYICLSKLTSFEWDRVFFVPSGGPISSPLAGFKWQEESVSEVNSRLASDTRYQLIAFERDGSVVEYDYYFTLWADLSAVGQPDGFDRNDSVFVADSNGDTYIVRPAASSGSNRCAE
ncbi:MAG: hypothetical protein GKS03_15630 [Alphaproteobacteria bacterium]|nr:hypothetical protein [Alphaproteobacteria bacterium]